MKKMASCVIWALYCGPFWTNGSVCQSAQTEPILAFNNIVCTKLQLLAGIFHEKNCLSHAIRPHVAGRFVQMHGCRLAKYGLIIFF